MAVRGLTAFSIGYYNMGLNVEPIGYANPWLYSSNSDLYDPYIVRIPLLWLWR
jgi:hypothetical protein